MVQQVTRIPMDVRFLNTAEGEISGAVIIDADGYVTESEIFIKERTLDEWHIQTILCKE